MVQRRLILVLPSLILLVLAACAAPPEAVAPTEEVVPAQPGVTSTIDSDAAAEAPAQPGVEEQATTSARQTVVEATPPTEVAAVESATTVATTGIPAGTAEAATLAPAGTVEVGITPRPMVVLPAPLYILEGGQIVRVEMDGATRTILTTEEPYREDVVAISQFDVSARDGALVYVVQRENGRSELVQAGRDGQERRVVVENALAVDPRWSPDGSQIAVRLSRYPDEQQGPDSGVYLIPAGGGEPRLFQADDPVADPANPPPGARSYLPVSWSPDGTRLALRIFSLVVEGCGLAVKSLDEGELITVAAPNIACATPDDLGVWSNDGSALFVQLAGQGTPAPPFSGVYRAEAATGVVAPVEGDAMTVLVRAPFELPDGTLRLFAAPSPAPGDTLAQLPYRMSEIPASLDPADRTLTPLRQESLNPGRVLWAEDGGGALVEVVPASGAPVLQWLTAGGTPPVDIPIDPIDLGGLRWGPQ